MLSVSPHCRFCGYPGALGQKLSLHLGEGRQVPEDGRQ